MLKPIWSVVPPRTSTPSITVLPCKPCSPFNVDSTLKLIGSSVICPMLRLATAREYPMSWKFAVLHGQVSMNTSGRDFPRHALDVGQLRICGTDVSCSVLARGQGAEYVLNAEKSAWALSGICSGLSKSVMLMFPRVSFGPITWMADVDAPRGCSPWTCQSTSICSR